MKRIITFLFIISVAFFALTGCKHEAKNLPELTGKTKEEIQEIFKKQKLSKKLEFDVFFSLEKEAGIFEKYGNELQAGDEIPEGKIVVFVTTDTYKLPDFKGKTLNEIKAILTESGVSEYFNFLPDIGTGPNVSNGFLKYQKHEVGEELKLDANKKIRIIYDARIGLPNLDDLNRKQIEEEFKALSFNNVTFEKVLDNSKEMDSFASYKEKEAGELLMPTDPVTVYIYENDDVNIGDHIGAPEQLFFSKYIEGTEGDLGLELYNPTGESLDLSEYYIAIHENGALKPTYEFNLEGYLASKETYLVTTDTATVEFQAKAQLITKDLKFDGNDTIQLRKKSNNTYIDSIYDLGNISFLMDDEIFVRRAHITHGRRDFKYDEWAGFIPEFKEIIGAHPYAIPERPTFVKLEETFQNYGMTKVKYLRAADGDTVYFESLDPRDPTSYDGKQRLRFLLIDTPETEKPGQEGQPYAQVATRFTKNAMENATEIYIQSDPAAGLTENYGRHLGFIWYNEGSLVEPIWKMLNYELLREGLGVSADAKTGNYKKSPIWNNRYLYQWSRDAVIYSQENKLGIYSGVHQD